MEGLVKKMNLLALQSNVVVSTEKGIWYRLHALHRMLPITSCNWAFSFTGAHAMHVFSLLGSCRSQIQNVQEKFVEMEYSHLHLCYRLGLHKFTVLQLVTAV